MVEGVACCRSYFAVCRDFAFGNGTNDAAESGVALLVFAKGVFQDSSFEVLRGRRGAHEEDFIRLGDGVGMLRQAGGFLFAKARRMGHPSFYGQVRF